MRATDMTPDARRSESDVDRFAGEPPSMPLLETLCSEPQTKVSAVAARPRSTQERLSDDLVKSSWERTQRSPTAALECIDEGTRLVISKTCAAGDEPLSDKAAHLVFNASLGSTDPAFAEALIRQVVTGT